MPNQDQPQLSMDAALLNAYEQHYRKVDSITEAQDALTIDTLHQQLADLVPYELDRSMVVYLVNQLDIPRQKVGDVFYLLISHK